MGTVLGIAVCWRHGGGLDRALRGPMFLQAIPYFFFAPSAAHLLELAISWR